METKIRGIENLLTFLIQAGMVRVEAEDFIVTIPDGEDQSRIVLSYPVKDKLKFWHLRERRLNELKEHFPGINVWPECMKALEWCKANPDRQKTTRGMERFIVNWLARAGTRGFHDARREIGGAVSRAGKYTSPEITKKTDV